MECRPVPGIVSRGNATVCHPFRRSTSRILPAPCAPVLSPRSLALPLQELPNNGVGTTPHVVLDKLFARRGLTYIHVPYKGTAEQMLAVASGQVMAGVNSNGFAPYIDSGRLRLLATFGAARTRRWPDVPTLSELGHGILAMSPYGLAGPRGLPAAVVRTLHDAFKAALFDPAHIAELARFDQEVAYLDSVEYGRSMRESYAAERRAIERLGLGFAPG
jgi:tripartite-type tricarboxylate transporter receptor subunit TctC